MVDEAINEVQREQLPLSHVPPAGCVSRIQYHLLTRLVNQVDKPIGKLLPSRSYQNLHMH
jgi:hypothetical protein